LLVLLLPILLWGLILPLWMRGGVLKPLPTLVSDARLGAAVQAVSYLKSYLILGAGAGAFDYAVERELDIEVESFYFQALSELGLMGGTIYILVWLSLTVTILRTDFYYVRRGHPAAWLPSSKIIFMWVASLASYGFGLFTGNLALLFAIAASATVDWARIKVCQQGGTPHPPTTEQKGSEWRSSVS
jgi:hypothetical protein